MATINSLTSLTTPAANDLLAIWDSNAGSGEEPTKKMAIGDFVQEINPTEHSGMTLQIGGIYRIGNIVIGQVRYNVTTAFSGTVLSGLPVPYSGTGSTNFICILSNKDFGSYVMDGNGNIKCDNVSTGALILSFCYVASWI